MQESNAMENYGVWINSRRISPTIKTELRNLIHKPDEIEDRFKSNLDFGTAGLRALMEAGTDRINVYTIAAAAGAVAEVIKQDGDEDKGVVISYDSRNNSQEFAEITARVMAKEGIRVYLSDELRPVPMLSFAIRHFAAAAGVMITASHNPKEYNGFKVYGHDGGQINAATAERIKGYIGRIDEAFRILEILESLDEMVDADQVIYWGSKIDEEYNKYICSLYAHTDINANAKKHLRIIYTPLNGSGNKPVMRALMSMGYESVLVVPEQQKPDGDFPTIRVPNPEFKDTFEVAIKYAKMSVADVIIATDPDSDRLGVAVPNSDGDYEVLTGNQIGLLLMEYILSELNAANSMPENAFCTTSLVSTGLAKRICDRYGVALYRTLTGSKYAAELIENRGKSGDENFVFGFEEGHGYMFGNVVRDKDAVAAAIAIAEMAARSKQHGNRLFNQLDAMFEFYGYCAEGSIAVTRDGVNGKDEINAVMEHYRGLAGKLGMPQTALSNIVVENFIDYSPEANLLYYDMGDTDWLAIRPSGTEPKLKVYVGIYGDKAKSEARVRRMLSSLQQDIDDLFGDEE